MKLQNKNAKNEAETQLPQGFPAQFASFVTFSANPLPESVVGVRFIEPNKWVRLEKIEKLEKLGSFGKNFKQLENHQRKNAKNEAKIQTPQGFPAHFASFVTFPENPLPESDTFLFFKNWVRFVKLATRKRLSFRAKRGIPKLLAKGIPSFARNDRLIMNKNAKNEAKTQSPQGFPSQFASFVTFPENPFSESVSARFSEKVNSRGDRQKGGKSGNLSFLRVSPFAVRGEAPSIARPAGPSFVTFPENPLFERVSTLKIKHLAFFIILHTILLILYNVFTSIYLFAIIG